MHSLQLNFKNENNEIQKPQFKAKIFIYWFQRKLMIQAAVFQH